MLADLRKIGAIFTPAERARAKWMLLLIILMAMVETAGVLSLAPFLSVLSRPGIIVENPWLHAVYERFRFGSAREFIVALGFASIAMVIASSLFKLVTQHVLNRFIHLARHSISVRLLSRYLNQPYEFFLARNSAELSKNILSEVDGLLFNLVQPLAQTVAQGAVVLAMALVIVLYDPWIAFGILAVIGLMYAAIYGIVRKKLGQIGGEIVEANAERYKACNEALGGIKDVKITHATSAYLTKFDGSARLFSRHLAANETLGQVPQYLVEAVGYAGLIVIALILLVRTDDAAHVMPALGLYGFAAYRMLPAAQIIYRGFARLKFSSVALDTVHRDLTLPVESFKPPPIALALRQEIRLDRISYAYPSAPDSPILDNFSLVIRANTCVGIVGESGAGKSTLMDILLGLLHPQAGTLRIDGSPLTSATVGNWQRTIGYIPQHIYLSDATVAENIAFGVPKEKIDIDAVERAAKVAQIHNFIVNELSDGYKTEIGERGIRLSGGQRQRIGIARALYRDPAVLLMDEATSALDAQTEEALNEAIRNLSGRKTIVIVAHKETSLQLCQKIISISQRQFDSSEKNSSN
ncbi:ABC transporter ATP-binding protein [Solimonas soli]|uniref:ABC transporter ATP-binding protein n=1 Tax=Solimonas soli TaxID=413479 RepID=UPI000686D1C2|nr:ABC transporter ATP-binding protein [Solimonas soli]